MNRYHAIYSPEHYDKDLVQASFEAADDDDARRIFTGLYEDGEIGYCPESGRYSRAATRLLRADDTKVAMPFKYPCKTKN